MAENKHKRDQILKDWISGYWWIALILLLLGYIVFISVVNDPALNRITSSIFHYVNQSIAPLGVILGLILGYPLLKNKLVASYVTKQFEIIYENNRIVRKEALKLKDKYPNKNDSKVLERESLLIMLEDVRKLNELAIDAHPYAYEYSYLLYKSVLNFVERTENNIPDDYHEHYYYETLSSFIHEHINRIYYHARSIGFIPTRSSIKEKSILVTKLDKYVTGNSYYEVEGIDNLISNRPTKALLVDFFSSNVKKLGKENGLLFECCYRSYPRPSPYARIMYNQGFYMPLVLQGEALIADFMIPQLILVGYKKYHSVLLDSGQVEHNIVFHYANISEFGFIDGRFRDKQSLLSYKDIYINEDVWTVDDIDDLEVNGERIIVTIQEEKVKKYFSQVKEILCKTMEQEMQ
jgi:hypothetical protein